MYRTHHQRTFALALLLALVLPLVAACGAQPAPAGTGAQSAATSSSGGASAPAPTAASAAPAEASPAGEATGANGDNVLRVHQITFPDVVDPQKSSFASEITLLALNYEGLTRLDKDLKAAPAAAESWEFSDDGTQITFKLHENMTYSDGSPLTAENFRYAVERTCDPNTAGQYQSFLFEIVGCEAFATAPVSDTAAVDAGRAQLLEQGVQAPDERTLVINLTRPAPYFPYIAGLWVFYPAKKELIEEGGENWWKDPAKQVGNGVFQISQFAEDQLVGLTANGNYWGGRAKLDGIEFIYQGDTAIAQEAYRAGQLDIAQVDPSQIPQIKGDAELSSQFVQYPAAATYAWGFNLTIEPFNDKKVREAFAYAIDRKTYCDVIRNGDCIATLSWIPQGVPGSIETTAYDFDPEKGRQALAESSYGGPEGLPEIKLSYNNDDPAATPRIEWIAGQLRENLGINVTLDPVEGKTLTALRKNPETYPQACVFCGNWFQDYPDPQNWLSGYWTCDAVQARRISYCNEEFDALIAKADVELDETKRIEMYEQAGQILIDDLPGPFVYNVANIFLIKPGFTGGDQTASDVAFPGQFSSQLTIDITR